MEMWDRGVLMGVEVLLCPPHLFICWFAWLQDSSAKARRTETGHAQQGEPLSSLRSIYSQWVWDSTKCTNIFPHIDPPASLTQLCIPILCPWLSMFRLFSTALLQFWIPTKTTTTNPRAKMLWFVVPMPVHVVIEKCLEFCLFLRTNYNTMPMNGILKIPKKKKHLLPQWCRRCHLLPSFSSASERASCKVHSSWSAYGVEFESCLSLFVVWQ